MPPYRDVIVEDPEERVTETAFAASISRRLREALEGHGWPQGPDLL